MNGLVIAILQDRKTAAYWGIVIALVIGALGMALWPNPAVKAIRNPHQQLFVDVKRAISGQKIRLDSDEEKYLVYAGIRTPVANEPLYDESRRRNAELVVNKEIRLRFGRMKRDPKGRVMAYVFVDNEFINETLVRDGMAYVRLTTSNNRFADRLLAAQGEARRARRGIWKKRKRSSKRESSYPADPKYGNFHRPNCDETPKINRKRRITLTSVTEALDKGLAPCPKCNP